MRLTAEQQTAITKKVGGTAEDGHTACTVLEAVLGFPGTDKPLAGRTNIDYGIETKHADSFIIRVIGGISIFTAQHAKQLRGISRRVASVKVSLAKQRISIYVTRYSCVGNAGARDDDDDVGKKKRRVFEIDYDAAKVTDPDDIQRIDEIIDRVYNARTRIPASMTVWFAPIVDSGAVYRGETLPLTSSVVDETSSETEIEEKMPETDRIGYSVCFSGMDEVSGEFMDALQREHGVMISNVYVWLFPPGDLEQLFVVNLRRTRTRRDHSAVVQDNLPKHICPPSKKVKVSPT